MRQRRSAPAWPELSPARERGAGGKRDALAAVLAGKALTERAAQLDADATRLRTKLAKAPRVQNANPLGAVLEQMIGATAAALTAWQQAIVAGVFELCLVGVMVIYELLGHANTSGGHAKADADVAVSTDSSIADAKRAAPKRPTRQSKAPQRSNSPVGNVKTFVHDRMYPAAGERIDMKALTADYRAWCAQKGVAALELDRFLDEIETVCRRAGIAIEVGDDKRVYCLDVRLEHIPAEPVHVH